MNYCQLCGEVPGQYRLYTEDLWLCLRCWSIVALEIILARLRREKGQ